MFKTSKQENSVSEIIDQAAWDLIGELGGHGDVSPAIFDRIVAMMRESLDREAAGLRREAKRLASAA